MQDLTDKRLICLKGGLFLLMGVAAAALLIAETPTWKTAGLVALAVWAFARAYYFAFYVIEHYVDPGYKFSGLGSFLRYVLTQRTKRQGDTAKAAITAGTNPPER